MKRYLLFFGDIYYASGGMNDLEGDFDTIEEAEKRCKELLAGEPVLVWFHIFDTLEDGFVSEGDESAFNGI